MIDYWIGVDGGGTGTRIRVEDSAGKPLGHASGGPSGLAHGIPSAWAVIEACIDQVLDQILDQIGGQRPGRDVMALGLGLAGVHNKQWAAEFVAHNPGYARVVLETDALTTLLGAHQGQPGAIIALGTGSVGEVLLPTGERREVGGWGFPVGDEASGAWMGLRGVSCAQQALDGRAPMTRFTQAIVDTCGGSRDAMLIWLANANQTRFAQLAPLVLEFAQSDQAALQILQDAGQEVAKMATALDPAGLLPLALCGGLAQAVLPYLPTTLRERLSPPKTDAVGGALHLLRQHATHGKDARHAG